jgi:hypothetical protein
LIIQCGAKECYCFPFDEKDADSRKLKELLQKCEVRMYHCPQLSERKNHTCFYNQNIVPQVGCHRDEEDRF